MRKRILLAVSIVALGGVGYAFAAGTTVSLTANGPQPEVVTVNWGDTVTFSNADSKTHGITIPRIRTESPAIGAGGAYEHVFDGRSGNYLFRQTGGGASFNGTVLVDLTGEVTLTPSAQVISYGQSVRMTGKSPYPGTPVRVALRPPGSGGTWAAVATVTAEPDGSFTTTVEPKMGARYRAQVAADQLASAPVLIAVRPLLRITATARRTKTGRRVTIIGRVTPAQAATSADLEIYDARRRRWFPKARGAVTRSGRVTFRWAALKGQSRLRVAVKPVGLQGGWTATASSSVTITGI
jgi:plastocyanin